MTAGDPQTIADVLAGHRKAVYRDGTRGLLARINYYLISGTAHYVARTKTGRVVKTYEVGGGGNAWEEWVSSILIEVPYDGWRPRK